VHSDLASFALAKHPVKVPTRILAQQLNGLKRALKKLPTLLDSREIIYPPQQNLEQTSSELTADYKARLTNAKTIADLTGGFGIDSMGFCGLFAFAKANEHTSDQSIYANKVYHIEQDIHLQQIAAENFERLQLPIESTCSDGVEWIKSYDGTLDLIYLDPARRDGGNPKLVQLEDYHPDVTDIMPVLLNKANQIMIKASPLLDINDATSKLGAVSDIYIVAICNEVKELLFLCNRHAQDNNPKVTAVNLESGQHDFSFRVSDRAVATYSKPEKFLFIPNAAISKSQAFDLLAERYKISKLATNTHLYTSDHRTDFPGRTFRIMEWEEFNLKRAKKKYGGGEYGVITRNLNGVGILGSVKALRKHLQIGEHEKEYIILARLQDDRRIIMRCIKQ